MNFDVSLSRIEPSLISLAEMKESIKKNLWSIFL